jgi:GT2 family glycosyltransferase
MSQPPDSVITVLSKSEADSYAGCALQIDFHDPDHIFGESATLYLTQPNRFPTRLARKVLLDEDGKGCFRSWAPAGLREIHIEVGKPLMPGTRRPSIKLRRIALWQVAVLATLKAPWSMLQTCRLLLSGNMRGFRYRFGLLYQRLNEPGYDALLAAAGKAGESTDLQVEAATRPRFLVSIVAGSGAASITRRSLAEQSHPNICEIDVNQLTAGGLDMEGEAFWMRLPAGAQLNDRAVELLLQPLLDDRNVAAAYCDEDRIDARGRRSSPFFKPAWNPPLAETGWLAPDGAVFRLSALRTDLDLQQADAGRLLLGASRFGRIAHVPRVLLHRHSLRRPALPSIPKSPQAKTNVSVIVPTRNRADLLRPCLDGLFQKTRHDDLDVIIIDNDSSDPETLLLFSQYEARGLINRVRLPGPFNFSRACNLGVANARHELVLLLNNDVEPIGLEWLDQMVAELDDDDIGAAGALLFFPDGFVQHAGVTLGSGAVARHSFQFLRPGTGEDLGLIDQRQEMSAVTGACLLTRRSLWEAVGGMEEHNLAVAFNDVDYCLKLRQIGKRIMWTPHARLLHRESVSRGRDDTPDKLARFASEEAYMYEKWGEMLANDPFYNPNLSLILGDHSLDVQPRDLSPRFSTFPFATATDETEGHDTKAGGQ